MDSKMYVVDQAVQGLSAYCLIVSIIKPIFIQLFKDLKHNIQNQ